MNAPEVEKSARIILTGGRQNNLNLAELPAARRGG